MDNLDIRETDDGSAGGGAMGEQMGGGTSSGGVGTPGGAGLGAGSIRQRAVVT